MLRKIGIGWVATLLVILLITLTGCQAIQGFDIAQALQNSASIKSVKASGSMKLDFLTSSTGSLTAEEKRLLDILKDMKVDFTNILLQDEEHVSIEGALSYAGGTIPFKIAVQDAMLVIHIEGAKKPISFDLSSTKTARPTAATANRDEQFTQKAKQLAPAVIKFFLNNAPNPEHFTVSSVTDMIHNEPLGLKKAHIEIYGNEIEGLLKKFLNNILADEKGLKELIGQLYDVFVPLMQEQMKSLSTPNNNSNTNVFVDPNAPNFENKTETVEYYYTKIQELLGKALNDWEEQGNSPSSPKVNPQTEALFSDKTSLKTDIMIDGDNQIRKLNLELTLPVTDISSGIEGVRLTLNSELSQINQPVTAATIDISKGTQDMAAMNTIKEGAFLALFDKSSKAYSLLRKDLKIAKKEVHLLLSTPADLHPSSATQPFINEEQVAMLPLRFISERFGAEVAWNGAKQQITIIDALSEKTIVMTIGSRAAIVNGTSVQMQSPAILKNGSTFVPLRFITEQLDGKVSFNGETRSVTITRE
ncbi:copper amine oxidase N-terminal domain-containing protein [Paenibacillus oryzisoli]|uniref:Copper amine oxidase-like N-terminal domain-containing protein n=1 Tax=Paenibacillus oryzisoli TaxID=1850517 RepID=A0A198A790_9BACL|nr:copper amine oxidase N-terminal domain-containing protein [Paenibacillus oryzisoli]OAS17339.1 hypothetical protein A8708_21425 [Paenibacillus oryzisoli]